MKNYYDILEVPVGSEVSAVRESYRRLVQENLFDQDRFTEMIEAYEVLTDPVRRAEYDRAAFGQTFGAVEAPPAARSQHCPMGAAAQCPVLTARAPLPDTYCPECGFLLSAMPEEGCTPVAALDETRLPRLEDAEGRTHRLRPGSNSVGRESGDILLPDKTVSRHHARIEVEEAPSGWRATVIDMNSTNGTQIHGQRLAPDTPYPLADGDALKFGSVPLSVRLPRAAATDALDATLIVPPAPALDRTLLTPGAAPPPPAPSQIPLARLVGRKDDAPMEHPLIAGVTTFGRRPENTVVLQGDPYVSGLHAQIIADESGFRLTDLGSTNGTFVNGERLEPNEPVELKPQDEVTLGSVLYRLVPTPHEEVPPVFQREGAAGEG